MYLYRALVEKVTYDEKGRLQVETVFEDKEFQKTEHPVAEADILLRKDVQEALAEKNLTARKELRIQAAEIGFRCVKGAC